jgi:hypothetical protein
VGRWGGWRWEVKGGELHTKEACRYHDFGEITSRQGTDTLHPHRPHCPHSPVRVRSQSDHPIMIDHSLADRRV